MRAYEQFGSGVVGVKEVSREAIRKYSSLKVEHIQDNYFRCTDMVEKPQPGQEFSLYSILGRCVLPPEIFDILDNTPPGAGGEIQLTDAYGHLGPPGRHDRCGLYRHPVRHGQQAGHYAGQRGSGPAAPGDRRGLPGLFEGAVTNA